jgi:uncharacterized membrane protein
LFGLFFRRKVFVRVLILVVIVLFVGLLFALDQLVKAVRQARRRREASRRLAAATAHAEAEARRRRASAEASGALTSVMPTIHDHDPRKVS